MKTILVSMLSILTMSAAMAQSGGMTRIVSINGNYSLTHDGTLKVYPGDVISLGVDEVDPATNTAMNKTLSEFQFTNPDDDGDCYNMPLKRRSWLGRVLSGQTKDPCADSNFEANQNGVNYYVPTDMGASIRINVRNVDDGSVDTIELVNQNPPAENAGGYYDDGTAFDYNASLMAHGRWVYLGGVRAFVPYGYMDGWQPYQNGYWYWSSIYGWTWYSYDPWGWVTDHYGYWRYTIDYGWVWIAFIGPDYYYHPHCVTFFYSDGYIGWSPYYGGWAGGYNYGYSSGYYHGFRDGYEAGFHAGAVSANGVTMHTRGITVIPNNGFGRGNVHGAIVRDETVMQNQWAEADRAQHVGPVLGGASAAESRAFATGRGIAVNEVAETRVQRTSAGGRSVEVVHPAQRVEVPDTYRSAQNGIRSIPADNGRTPRLPVGSRVDYNHGVVNTPRGGATRVWGGVANPGPVAPNRGGGYQPPRTMPSSPRSVPSMPRSIPSPNRTFPSAPSFPSRPSMGGGGMARPGMGMPRR